MYKTFRIGLICLMLGVCAWLTWHIAAPAAAVSGSSGMAVLASTGVETWNMGVQVDGPPIYQEVAGRLVSNSGTFRSARAAAGAFIFPAPATARTVEAANAYLLDRSGTYAGPARLALVIYDYAGVIQHTVSSVDIDLQAAPLGEWLPLSLSANPDDLIVSSGEFLAFSFLLSGPAGGDLNIHPLFEVSVR